MSLKEVLKDAPIVELAIGLNLIMDVIDRVKEKTGVELTPEDIGDYAAQRTQVRQKLNAEVGVTE